MLEFKENWDEHLSLIEFAYNNSYHLSIGMKLYMAENVEVLFVGI